RAQLNLIEAIAYRIWKLSFFSRSLLNDAAGLMSAIGTKRTSRDVRFYAAVGGQADIGHGGRARAARSRPSQLWWDFLARRQLSVQALSPLVHGDGHPLAGHLH